MSLVAETLGKPVGIAKTILPFITKEPSLHLCANWRDGLLAMGNPEPIKDEIAR